MIVSDAQNLLIAGGGTGGHLFPGIALGQAFQERFASGRVLYVIKGNVFEISVLENSGFPYVTMDVAGLKGKGLWACLSALAKIPGAMRASRRILQGFRPDRVIGVGGYVCGPLVLTAWLMGIPVVLQEQNVKAGITNRLLLPLARRMYVADGYDAGSDRRPKIRCTGNPLRREFTVIAATQAVDVPEETGKRGPFTVLVLGGSQGAHVINLAVCGALAGLKDLPDLKFVHQTGSQDLETVRREYAQHATASEIAPFFKDMRPRYQTADLVICRAGALTVAEITAMGKAALMIPFPFAADNHQELNARYLQQRGAAEMLLERDLTPQRLADRIRFYRQTPAVLRAMAEAARQLGRPQAARDIIEDMFG